MEVTREQLVDALAEFHLWITPDRTQDTKATGVFGTVQNPGAMADGLLLALKANAAHEDKPWIADTEIAVISRTVADLDLISDTVPSVTSGSVWRVLHYLADRYGYVLATED